MKLTFLGAAGTVTGSKTLLETVGKNNKSHSILVDCGLFQGLKELRLRNWAPFPVAINTLDAVILTHAHLDHSGYLPLLVKSGFKGRIFCTNPTRDLVALVLRDAARLQQEDADYANKKGFSKHHPAQPLFTIEDAERAIHKLEVIGDEKFFTPCRGIEAKFKKNGHILGSSVVVLESESLRITFSGDLGRSNPLLYFPPKPLEATDYIILESTYGDRDHLDSQEKTETELAQIVNETVSRQGVVIVPSFAIGRSQEMLYLLSRLIQAKTIPAVPVYLDTPMGTSATEIFMSNPNWHRLSESAVSGLYNITKIVKSQEESIKVMRDPSSKIIIAGSGMAVGGRVLHHLAHGLSDKKNTVVFAGFQAEGTRGRSLIEGAPEIKLHGRMVPVHATVKILSSLSSHSDQSETLQWLKTCPQSPKCTFIQHGEPKASLELSKKISSELGWKTMIPTDSETISLNP